MTFIPPWCRIVCALYIFGSKSLIRIEMNYVLEILFRYIVVHHSLMAKELAEVPTR